MCYHVVYIATQGAYVQVYTSLPKKQPTGVASTLWEVRVRIFMVVDRGVTRLNTTFIALILIRETHLHMTTCACTKTGVLKLTANKINIIQADTMCTAMLGYGCSHMLFTAYIHTVESCSYGV